MAMADLATPMAIRVAATLRLVEHAGTQGATADELASRTQSSAPALRQLLAHLVTARVFELDHEGLYHPTNLGRQIPDHSLLLDQMNAGGRAEVAFVGLLDTIATGEPAYPKQYGRSFWDDLDRDPRLRSSFDA